MPSRMFTFAASACSVAMDWLMHSFHQQMHKPPIKFPISPFHFSNIFPNLPTSKTSFAPMAVNWNFYPQPPSNKLLLKSDRMTPASVISLTQNVTKDQTSRKVKILCSFGGKIIDNRQDEKLDYVGGQSRIIAFRRDIVFQEFYSKMKDAYGGPVRIYYQYPKKSLDTLISVYSVEDFENMMDEIDDLSKVSSCGSTKLRIILFPRFGLQERSDKFKGAASNDCGLTYINKTSKVFASDANDTNNLSNQLDTINTNNQRQQHGVTTNDVCSLFSDWDPWKTLDFQLSNIN